MANEITKHFTEQFNSELYVAFQNEGSVMRARSRRKTGVIGYRTHFPKIGLASTALPKTRAGKVPLQDIARDRVFCDLQDFYGATTIDKLDELKTNVEEKSAVQQALVMSLARSEDDIATAELATSTNPANVLGSSDSWSSDAVHRQMLATFGRNEAFEGGTMHALVSWAAWADLLALNTFINSQFGGDTDLPVEGVKPKVFFGFAYAPFSRLPLSGVLPINMWWNPKTIGTAVGQEIEPSTDWLPESHNWLIKATMSQGAKILDSTGIVLRRYSA